MVSSTIFQGADRLWTNVMKNAVKFINDNGGKATLMPTISKRLSWNKVFPTFTQAAVQNNTSTNNSNKPGSSN